MRKIISILVLLYCGSLMAMGTKIPGDMTAAIIEFSDQTTLVIVQDFNIKDKRGKNLNLKKGQKISVHLSVYSGVDTRENNLENMIKRSAQIELRDGNSFYVLPNNLKVSALEGTPDSYSRIVTEACTLRDDVKVCKDGKYTECEKYNLERNGIKTTEITDILKGVKYNIAVQLQGKIVAKMAGSGLSKASRTKTLIPCH